MGLLDDLVGRLRKDDPKPDGHKGPEAEGQPEGEPKDPPGAFGDGYCESSRKILGL